MTTEQTADERVRRNRVVLVHMRVFERDGTLLQSTEADGPFAYLHGHGNLIKKLEDALDGLVAGERCEIAISPAEGYGERVEDVLVEVPRSSLAPDMALEVGTQVAANGPEGQMEFTVVEIGEDTVTLDANHPLAGKELLFELQVEAVRPAHKDEIKHRRPHPAGHHLMMADSSFDEDAEGKAD